MGRSILSIVTGIVVWGTLWVSANMGLARAFPGRFDDSGITGDPVLLGIFLLVSAALSIGAGWLCAAIARRAIMKHVLALAFIQLGIGIGVQAGVWDLMPVWYHVVFLALVVPMHVAGGRVQVGRRARAGEGIGALA